MQDFFTLYLSVIRCTLASPVETSNSLRLKAALLSLLFLPLTGCLVHQRPVEPRAIASNLKEATSAELLDKINSQAARIKTLQATVDISTSVGGERKGKIIDYPDISGYVLVRKPTMLRMIGLVPVVRTHLFDMVSDGKQFKLSIPSKSKFVVGSGDVIQPSEQPLENLRPQHIMEALLLPAIDAEKEIAVTVSSTEKVRLPGNKKEVDQPDYVVLVIDRDANGWYLSRRIIFSREDLAPHRQVVYNRNGVIVTDAHYEKFNDHDGVLFPDVIQILRPKEEYSIQLTIEKLTLNAPLTDEQFALTQPAGSLVQDLDKPGAPVQPAKPAAQGKPKKPKK